MSELEPWAIPLIAYIVGVVFRIVAPYVYAWLTEGAKFDIKYVIGQALAGLAGLAFMLASQEFLAGLASIGWLLAFFAGAGIASLGREGQKVFSKSP